MFYYSFSTILMTVLTSNLLIILISLCFKSNRLMVSLGYKLLAVFAGFTLLRLIFPFEFPFSINFILPRQISRFISFIRHPFYQIGGLDISIWLIFEVIWAVGVLIGLRYHIKRHLWLRKAIRTAGIDVTDLEPYAGLLKRTCPNQRKISAFRIIELPCITVPMYYSFRTHYILLPKDTTLSDREMYFAFSHELSHYSHRDLWIKNIILLLSILYWWNPFCLLLRKSTDIILEMRVDFSLTRSNDRLTIEYLRCLIHMAELSALSQEIPSHLSVSFFKESEGNLEKRFHMMCNRKKASRHCINILLTGLILTVYVISYIFIFEASYTPENADATFLTTDNTYAVISENDTYDIYFNDIFVENVDNLEFYPDSIHIYNVNEKENLNEKTKLPEKSSNVHRGMLPCLINYAFPRG